MTILPILTLYPGEQSIHHCFEIVRAFLRGQQERRSASALEGYLMITEPGQEITWGALHVGSSGIFAAARRALARLRPRAAPSLTEEAAPERESVSI